MIIIIRNKINITKPINKIVFEINYFRIENSKTQSKQNKTKQRKKKFIALKNSRI